MYTAPTDTDTITLPCLCEDSHGQHFAHVRKELGGRAVLEVIAKANDEGEVAASYYAVFRSLVDWDLPGPDGGKLPLTQESVDNLHLGIWGKLREPALAAVKKGNTPLPNGSGGRSRGTSPANRSQRRSKA